MFKNIDSIQMMKSDIWTPDLTIYNAMTSSTELEKEDFMVTVSSEGHVIWYPSMLLDSSCQISVAKFPFDRQMCEIIIRSRFRDINTQIFSAKIKEGNIEQNAAWNLTKTKMTCDYYEEIFQTCSFQLFLSRRPGYDILHILCPVVLLSVMKGFVFLLPSNSGEKVTFCISIFLTFSVLLDSIQSALPVTSLESSYFGVFVFFQFCLCGIESCVSVLILRLSCKSKEDTIPTFLKKLCVWLRLIPSQKSANVVSPSNIRQGEYNKENNDATHDGTPPINDTDKTDDNGIGNTDPNCKIPLGRIVIGLDKFCFIIFSGVSVMSYVVLFILLFS